MFHEREIFRPSSKVLVAAASESLVISVLGIHLVIYLHFCTHIQLFQHSPGALAAYRIYMGTDVLELSY